MYPLPWILFDSFFLAHQSQRFKWAFPIICRQSCVIRSLFMFWSSSEETLLALVQIGVNLEMILPGRCPSKLCPMTFTYIQNGCHGSDWLKLGILLKFSSLEPLDERKPNLVQISVRWSPFKIISADYINYSRSSLQLIIQFLVFSIILNFWHPI